MFHWMMLSDPVEDTHPGLLNHLIAASEEWMDSRNHLSHHEKVLFIGLSLLRLLTLMKAFGRKTKRLNKKTPSRGPDWTSLASIPSWRGLKRLLRRTTMFLFLMNTKGFFRANRKWCVSNSKQVSPVQFHTFYCLKWTRTKNKRVHSTAHLCFLLCLKKYF